MLGNAVEISLIFRRILGPLVLGWAPNHSVLGAQLAPGKKGKSVSLLSFSLFLMQQTPCSIVVKCDGSVYDVDVEIISTVILLSADSFKKGCCQLQVKVCAQINGYLLVQACPGNSKSVVR